MRHSAVRLTMWCSLKYLYYTLLFIFFNEFLSQNRSGDVHNRKRVYKGCMETKSKRIRLDDGADSVVNKSIVNDSSTSRKRITVRKKKVDCGKLTAASACHASRLKITSHTYTSKSGICKLIKYLKKMY